MQAFNLGAFAFVLTFSLAAPAAAQYTKPVHRSQPKATKLPAAALVEDTVVGRQARRADAIKRANAFFNTSPVLNADFVQIGADGKRSEGKLYSQRGRVRFEYAQPTTLELVADGALMLVRDSKLKTQNIYAIHQTPLKFLLKEKIDFEHDFTVLDVTTDDAGVAISLEDKATFGGESHLKLTFDPKTFEPRQWQITNVAAFQCPVRMDVKSNFRDLETAVSVLPPNTLIVAPEGLLSGYLPERGFVRQIDEPATFRAIQETQALAARASAYIVAGACVRVDGAWHNSAFCFAPDGRSWRYDKINLAQSERDDFSPGRRLSVIDIQLEGKIVRLGVQMCREIQYPEQWRRLATQGAEIIAFVNNAVESLDGYELWRAHVVSRAAEVQRFIVGANKAAADQKCTTLVVAPSGRVLIEAPPGETSMIVSDIDLTEVSDWVISQARTDVVSVTAVNDRNRSSFL